MWVGQHQDFHGGRGDEGGSRMVKGDQDFHLHPKLFGHFLTVLEILNFSQQLFLIVCQGPVLFASVWRWRARDVHSTHGIPLSITAWRFSEWIGFFAGMVMKPSPVLGTQRLIGPPEEATLFLGTIQKQAIGVTNAQPFLHPAIVATQLSNCQKSTYPLCVWHFGTGS